MREVKTQENRYLGLFQKKVLKKNNHPTVLKAAHTEDTKVGSHKTLNPKLIRDLTQPTPGVTKLN